MITIGGVEIPNPEPIIRTYRLRAKMKDTVEGLVSVQTSTTLNLGWKIRFRATTRAAIEAVYAVVAEDASLVIDGTTYPNVVIIDREDVIENEPLNDFTGGITIVQNTFAGGAGSVDQEMLVNGGFELGALTSWGTTGGQAAVLASALYEGAYGCRLKVTYGGTQTIYQSVDLTGVEDLTYAIRIQKDDTVFPPEVYTQQPLNYSVSVGGVTVRTGQITDLDTWHEFTDDVSSYEGTNQIVFTFSVPTPDSTTYGCYANLDSVSAIKLGSET